MGDKEKEFSDIHVRILEYTKYAQDNGFELNPNHKIVENIVRVILKREKEMGAGYCPCRLVTGDKEVDRKIICPCVYHIEELDRQGYCHCRLFVKNGTV